MTAPVRPSAREDLAVVELDGEAVIYDERTGSLHHLNPSATLVFSLCDGSATIRDLVAELEEALEVPAGELEPQVRGVLRGFRRQGLLAPAKNGAARG